MRQYFPNIFQSIFMDILNKHAPMEEKYIHAHNAPLRTKLTYCVNLLRREKRKYYENLDLNKITDNKTFWKQMKPFFFDKSKSSKHITLIEGEDIVYDDLKVGDILNNFFVSSISNLNIRGYNTPAPDAALDKISNIIYMFKSHPSIRKIKDREGGGGGGGIISFHFFGVNEVAFSDEISRLDISKPTTFKIYQQAKILTDTKAICSSYLSVIFTNSLSKHYFRLKNG